MKKSLLAAAIVFAGFAAHAASADVGVGLRGGTLGYGADLDFGVTERLTLRVAYNYLNYNRSVDDTNVHYDGTLKISSVSGFLDVHPFKGGFRLSLGAVGSGPKIDVVGTPTNGSYQIGDNTYTASQVGSVNGEIKFGNSVAPYVGIGYGNAAGKSHRVTFLFDLGAIYGGTPNVNLTATCGASIVGTPTCTQLQSDVAVEIDKLKNNASEVKWYPIVSIGLGVRF